MLGITDIFPSVSISLGSMNVPNANKKLFSIMAQNRFSTQNLSDQLFVKRFSADTPTCIHHVYISYSHSSVPVQEQHAAGTTGTHLGRCFPKFRRESRPQRASEHLQNTIIHSKSLEKLAGNQISFLKSQTHRNQIKLFFSRAVIKRVLNNLLAQKLNSKRIQKVHS